jgi:hypothetical protein
MFGVGINVPIISLIPVSKIGENSNPNSNSVNSVFLRQNQDGVGILPCLLAAVLGLEKRKFREFAL